MMDIIEIRQGNYVLKRSSKDIFHIDSTSNYVKVSRSPQLYEPIPIDEEWLDRLGFSLESDERDSITYFKNAFNYYLTFDHEDIRLDFMTKQGYHCIFYDDKCMLYVHQLQNFYHAHTGQELTL